MYQTLKNFRFKPCGPYLRLCKIFKPLKLEINLWDYVKYLHPENLKIFLQKHLTISKEKASLLDYLSELKTMINYEGVDFVKLNFLKKIGRKMNLSHVMRIFLTVEVSIKLMLNKFIKVKQYVEESYLVSKLDILATFFRPRLSTFNLRL